MPQEHAITDSLLLDFSIGSVSKSIIKPKIYCIIKLEADIRLIIQQFKTSKYAVAKPIFEKVI